MVILHAQLDGSYRILALDVGNKLTGYRVPGQDAVVHRLGSFFSVGSRDGDQFPAIAAEFEIY